MPVLGGSSRRDRATARGRCRPGVRHLPRGVLGVLASAVAKPERATDDVADGVLGPSVVGTRAFVRGVAGAVVRVTVSLAGSASAIAPPTPLMSRPEATRHADAATRTRGATSVTTSQNAIRVGVLRLRRLSHNPLYTFAEGCNRAQSEPRNQRPGRGR